MLALHEKRQCRCTEHTGEEDWHGQSTSGYFAHRCDCDACRLFMRTYMRDRYRANPEPTRATNNAWRNRNLLTVREREANYRASVRPFIRRREEAKTEARRQLKAQADRDNRRWTPAEDLMVLRTDLRVVEIAAVLGRTFRAVKARRSYLRKAGA